MDPYTMEHESGRHYHDDIEYCGYNHKGDYCDNTCVTSRKHHNRRLLQAGTVKEGMQERRSGRRLPEICLHFVIFQFFRLCQSLSAYFNDFPRRTFPYIMV